MVQEQLFEVGDLVQWTAGAGLFVIVELTPIARLARLRFLSRNTIKAHISWEELRSTGLEE